MWKTIYVNKGSILEVGSSSSTGCRSYLAIHKGISVPLYLGSRSTFTLGKFGGH